MSDRPWWQDAVVYQVYIRSFADSDGDGIGDLEGLRSRLDHLEALGVDALWLNPCYPSPQRDHGYDVADYFGIHHEYGDLATFDALVADAARRGIRILMDLVPNHCSSDTRCSGRRSLLRPEARSGRGSGSATGATTARATPTAHPPTTGWRRSGARPGRAFRRTTRSGIWGRSLRISPISTTATPSSTRCSGPSSISGSTAGWTASGSTRSAPSGNTLTCPTNRRYLRGHIQ